MTPAKARELILRVFVDRTNITPQDIRDIRAVQKDRDEPESEALFRVAGIPYPGPDYVKKNPESIRLTVSAAAATEAMEELWARGHG